MNSPNWLARLQAVEIFIRRELTKADASPFIAHVDLNEADEQKIAIGVREFVAGQPRRISQCLIRFPAATAWFLATSLARNYRNTQDSRPATSAIYLHIEKAFEVTPLGNQERLEAVIAFRRAANKLGLVLPPQETPFYADNYVCQAGIAHSQLPALVTAFLKSEAAFGPPAEEDTQRLNMWEVRAAQTFTQGLSRLQNIMRWDETAYHAGEFARVRRNEISGPLGKAMADAIATVQASDSISGLVFRQLPRLALVDGAPALIASNEVAIDAKFGGRQRTVPAGRSWELPPPWSSSITIRELDGDGTAPAELSFLTTPESIAIFDSESGVLLGQLASNGSTIVVDAREIAIASRNRIVCDGLESQQMGGEAHILFVRGGSSQQISVGSSTFQIEPPSRPAIWIEGERILKGAGGGLFCHPKSLKVTVPGEIPEHATVTINHTAMDTPVHLPLNQDTEVDLVDLLPNTGSVGRLSVIVSLGEKGRALVKSSQWVWPGLRGMEDLTFDGPIPPNFSAERSEHIVSNGVRLGLDGSQEWRVARIAFYEGDESVSFDVPRPGLSVSILDDYGRETIHKLGDPIVISKAISDRMVIRTNDPTAILSICGVQEESSFGPSGMRKLALSSLGGSGGNNRIQYFPGGDPRRAIDIARLSLSTEPSSFFLQRDNRKQSNCIHVDINGHVDAAKIRLSGFAGEDVEELTVQLGRTPIDGNRSTGFSGEAEYLAGSQSRSRIYMVIDDGVAETPRIAKLSFRLEGEEHLREMRNLRGDSYIFLLGPAPELASRKEYLTACDLLNRCVAAEVWPSIKCVVDSWRSAGELLVEQGRVDVLFEGWGLALPPGQSTSWVPIRHPIELYPSLLSVDAVKFHAIGEAGDGTSELAALHRLAAAERVRDATTLLMVDPSFFMGFANWRDAALRSIRLRDFSVKNLVSIRQTMASGDRPALQWRPDSGRLTGQHHEWCIEQFVDRFEMAMPTADANAERMVRLNRMINALARDHRDHAIPVSERLMERCQIADNLAKFMSGACLAWRQDTFSDLVKEICHSTITHKSIVLEDIGLLLRLAPELTAFYLLLWELVQMSER